MSRSVKNSRTVSRAPVDAMQYEKLALSACRLVDRQITQLNNLITLATSIYKSPAVTVDERYRQRTLLGLLIDTGEEYRREVEADQELYSVIALDAKGTPQACLTARHATKLLARSAEIATKNRDRDITHKSTSNGRVRFKAISRRTETAH
ncbi:hypothetical protein [Paraburkholderia bryophila]|uniref:hypothetical protein n=1 Tax=Paraburkholderia bryophila TaxID=420952 RepID=UPI000DD02804|nr:hypothetical protein [Paraburkholderia bryophila]